MLLDELGSGSVPVFHTYSEYRYESGFRRPSNAEQYGTYESRSETLIKRCLLPVPVLDLIKIIPVQNLSTKNMLPVGESFRSNFPMNIIKSHSINLSEKAGGPVDLVGVLDTFPPCQTHIYIMYQYGIYDRNQTT